VAVETRGRLVAPLRAAVEPLARAPRGPSIPRGTKYRDGANCRGNHRLLDPVPVSGSHPRRVGYAHQQTFRSQQSRDDLAPRFLSRRNQQFVALRLQFRCGFFDIPYVKFDPPLWHGKIDRPLIRAKAGLSRLCR
jgi:hypothetical protein